VNWKGPEKGIYAMRGQYLRYLKGLPDFATYRAELMRAATLQAAEAALDAIATGYAGFELTHTEIEMIDYHSTCKL
jgi:hypothetical protein